MAQNDEIFATLERDHDRHRELLDKLLETSGDSDTRESLFTELTRELKSHAAAEEQALYSTMLRKPPTTGETRHSVAEHHCGEIDLGYINERSRPQPQVVEGMTIGLQGQLVSGAAIDYVEDGTWETSPRHGSQVVDIERSLSLHHGAQPYRSAWKNGWARARSACRVREPAGHLGRQALSSLRRTAAV